MEPRPEAHRAAARDRRAVVGEADGAAAAVLCNEDRQHFYALIDELLAIYQPLNQLAASIVKSIATARWQIERLNRCLTIEWNLAIVDSANAPASLAPELAARGLAPAVREQVEIEVKYEGYIERMKRKLGQLPGNVRRRALRQQVLAVDLPPERDVPRLGGQRLRHEDALDGSRDALGALLALRYGNDAPAGAGNAPPAAVAAAAHPGPASVRLPAAIADADKWMATLDRIGMVSPRAMLAEELTVAQGIAMAFENEFVGGGNAVARTGVVNAQDQGVVQTTGTLEYGAPAGAAS